MGRCSRRNTAESHDSTNLALDSWFEPFILPLPHQRQASGGGVGGAGAAGGGGYGDGGGGRGGGEECEGGGGGRGGGGRGGEVMSTAGWCAMTEAMME